MLSTRDRRMLEEIKRGLCAADPALSNCSEPQWRTRWNRFVPREQGLRQPRGESALEPSLPAVGLAIPGGVVVTTLDARVRGACGTLLHCPEYGSPVNKGAGRVRPDFLGLHP